MNYRTLGKSDLKISEVCFGCMSLKIDNSENEKILLEAYDNGINFYDTADLYDKGHNEVIVGKALQKIRNKIYIATKVGNKWNANGATWEWKANKTYILGAVEESLKRLKTNYIDLYQLHGGTIEDPIDEIIEAFELLIEQGKIRNYGISSIRPNVIEQYALRSNITSVMSQYSLLDRRPEESSLPLLKKYQIGVIARGSIAQGILVNKEPKKYLDKEYEEVLNLIEEYKNQFEDRNLLGIALQYNLIDQTVASNLVGIRTNEHLNELINSLKIQPLNNFDIKKLKYIFRVNYYTDHR